MKTIALLLISIAALVGCLAAGVPYTSDPYNKLGYAYVMLDECRPHAAKRFIDEVFQKFSNEGNEIGMAEAYHSYGGFYKVFSENPTYSKCLTGYLGSYADPGGAKSLSYYQKAVELYEKNNNHLGVSKCYFGIGNLYHRRDNQLACSYYDKCIEEFEKARRLDPAVKFPIRSNYRDVYHIVDEFKKDIGCGSGK